MRSPFERRGAPGRGLGAWSSESRNGKEREPSPRGPRRPRTLTFGVDTTASTHRSGAATDFSVGGMARKVDKASAWASTFRDGLSDDDEEVAITSNVPLSLRLKRDGPPVAEATPLTADDEPETDEHDVPVYKESPWTIAQRGARARRAKEDNPLPTPKVPPPTSARPEPSAKRSVRVSDVQSLMHGLGSRKRSHPASPGKAKPKKVRMRDETPSKRTFLHRSSKLWSLRVRVQLSSLQCPCRKCQSRLQRQLRVGSLRFRQGRLLIRQAVASSDTLQANSTPVASSPPFDAAPFDEPKPIHRPRVRFYEPADRVSRPNPLPTLLDDDDQRLSLLSSRPSPTLPDEAHLGFVPTARPAPFVLRPNVLRESIEHESIFTRRLAVIPEQRPFVKPRREWQQPDLGTAQHAGDFQPAFKPPGPVAATRSTFRSPVDSGVARIDFRPKESLQDFKARKAREGRMPDHPVFQSPAERQTSSMPVSLPAPYGPLDEATFDLVAGAVERDALEHRLPRDDRAETGDGVGLVRFDALDGVWQARLAGLLDTVGS